MKKSILLAVLVASLLCSCGTSGSTSSAGNMSASSPSESEVSSSSESSDSDESPYGFKDNVIKLEDATITITDYKIIPPGEKGNEYSEKPIIAFWYSVTNESEDLISASTAWVRSVTAIQDNDPNIVNELEVTSLPDDRFLDTQLADIKPGGTLENAIGYELTDLETPVILEAKNGLFGDVIGEQSFELK